MTTMKGPWLFPTLRSKFHFSLLSWLHQTNEKTPAIAHTRVVGPVNGNGSNVTRLDPRAKNAVHEASHARATRFDYAGVLASPPEAASMAQRSRSKSQYHRIRNGDGTSEIKPNTARVTIRGSPCCFWKNHLTKVRRAFLITMPNLFLCGISWSTLGLYGGLLRYLGTGCHGTCKI